MAALFVECFRLDANGKTRWTMLQPVASIALKTWGIGNAAIVSHICCHPRTRVFECEYCRIVATW